MTHSRSQSEVPPPIERPPTDVEAKEAADAGAGASGPPVRRRRRSSAAWAGGATVDTTHMPEISAVEDDESVLLDEPSSSSQASNSKDDNDDDEPSVSDKTPRRLKKRRSLTEMVMSSRKSSDGSKSKRNSGGSVRLKRSGSAKSRVGTLRSPRFDDNSSFNSISRRSNVPAKKHSEILNSSRYSRLNQNMQMHNSIFQQIARLVGSKNQRPTLEGAFDAPTDESKEDLAAASTTQTSSSKEGVPTPTSPYTKGKKHLVFGGSASNSEKEAHQDKAFEWFLEEAAARRYFASFLKKRKEVENLMLWADCKDFAGVTDKQLRLQRVKRINDRYVTKDARFRVKLDSGIVKRILKASKSYDKWVTKHKAAEEKRNAKLLKKGGGSTPPATKEEVEEDAASAGDFSLAIYEEAMEFVTAKLREPFKDFLGSPEYTTYLRVAKRHHSYRPQNLNQISWQEVQDLVHGKNPALLQKDPSLFGQKLLEEGVPIKEVMRIVSAAKLRKQEQLDAARRKSSAHSRSGGGGNSSLSSLHSPSTSVYPSSLSSSSVHTVTRCHNVMRGSDSGMRASPSSNPSSVESGSSSGSSVYPRSSGDTALSLSSTGAYVGSALSPRQSVSTSTSGTNTPPNPYSKTESNDEDTVKRVGGGREDTTRELSRSKDLNSDSALYIVSPTSAPGACEPSSLRRSMLKKARSGDKTKSADITDMDPTTVMGPAVM